MRCAKQVLDIELSIVSKRYQTLRSHAQLVMETESSKELLKLLMILGLLHNSYTVVKRVSLMTFNNSTRQNEKSTGEGMTG